MPERGGRYQQPEGGKPADSENDAVASVERAPKKFTRRGFLELAAVGASGLLAPKIFGGRDNPETSSARRESEPLRVSPPEPPENLPVEPLNNETAEYDLEGIYRGKEGGHKKNEQKDTGRTYEFDPLVIEKEIEQIIRSQYAGDQNKIDSMLKKARDIFEKENNHVKQHRFKDKGWDLVYFKHMLERRDELFSILEKFEKYNVPKAVIIGVIAGETALKPEARPKTTKERETARGYMRFEAATARGFGLRVDEKHDDRFSLPLSIKASAKYLNFLHNKYGSWSLAGMAYGMGGPALDKRIRDIYDLKDKTKINKDLIAEYRINQVYLYEHWDPANKNNKHHVRKPFDRSCLARRYYELLNQKDLPPVYSAVSNIGRRNLSRNNFRRKK